jgi:2-oxoisovalerate dehydrogenase E1 component
MPICQFIDPETIRKESIVQFDPIPVNTYRKTLFDVKNAFSDTELINLYFDMALIREFENMVHAVRTVKVYNGIEYSYTGPAHLSQGQEAAAVGQAYVLDINDYSFGTHRSHGEVIARGMAAIRKLEEKNLLKIMENFREGALLRNVEKITPRDSSSLELGIHFLLYGFMTELFGREIGFTGGLGNSMHVFFTPFGIYPNNAIVGGSAGIGVGAALYKKLNHQEGIVVVNMGDGAVSTGHVWESINLSAMDQYYQLWEEPYQGGLPLIFNIVNNCYAMSGQTTGETLGIGILAKIGAPFGKNSLFAERIDGINVFSVIDAFKRKKELVKQKKGPALIETLVYRHTGHSATDPNAYRSREEMEAWMRVDCLSSYKQQLIEARILTPTRCDQIEREIKEKITNILRYAVDSNFSPRMNLKKDPDAIARHMFSNRYVHRLADRPPEVLGKKEDNSRMKKIAQKNRRGVDENGKPVSGPKVYSYRDAIFEALLDKFYDDPTMILFGEDVREHGNSFGVLQGLHESVPRHRLFNTPIAEGAIISAAVGYAISGGRSVPEIMWCDFLGRCADELFNQLAKWQGMSAGVLSIPCVVRISIGAYYGAQHSQDWSSLPSHIPGLKIVYPATPYDAKGLLNSALSSLDPILFFESQKLYDIGERFMKDGVPRDYYEVPIGKCDIKRKGKDLTIVTIGPTLYPALEAATELEHRWGWTTEVVDARTLVPFDYETVVDSVCRTGKVIIVHDACERGGYAKTIASNIAEFAFDYLDSPPVALGSHNWVSPCPELEQYFFPSKDLILSTIHERIKPLPGYIPEFDCTISEKMRRESKGI